MREMTVSASPDQIDAVMDFVNGQLEEMDCPKETRIDVDVAVDELLGNIVQYAYRPGTGTVTVRVDTAKNPAAVTITFADRGSPFNPLAKEAPDTTSLPAGKRPAGGLGLFMTRRLMDDLTYAYRDGQNVLTARKAISWSKEEQSYGNRRD